MEIEKKSDEKGGTDAPVPSKVYFVILQKRVKTEKVRAFDDRAARLFWRATYVVAESYTLGTLWLRTAGASDKRHSLFSTQRVTEMYKRRKSKFVDAPVQGAIIRQGLRQWICFVFVAMTAILCLHMLTGGAQLSWAENLELIWKRYAIGILACAALLPICILDVINLSHRFVGPVVRIRNAMDELAQGKNVEPVAFRESDYWSDLADSFNRLLTQIGQPEPAASSPPSTTDLGVVSASDETVA